MMYTLPAVVLAEEASVRGVLFFSPTCGHCQIVKEEFLPPLQDQYGDQLVLIMIDVTTPDGNFLFRQAIDQFEIPLDRQGVPMLIVGETVLVGSNEIPSLFPGIVETGLASGGIPSPDIPGLETSQQEQINEQEKTGFLENFNRDRTANLLSVIVLAGMIFSVIWIGYASFRSSPFSPGSWPGWVIPVLAVAGLLIAAYLSFIEITHTEAICGPVGDCNAVQSSRYARLFGRIPIGVLGLAGYLAILASWLFQLSGSHKRQKLAVNLSWLLALVGTLLSIYLTFLEPFVIGATCIWCITSAIIMTLLFWATTGLALSQLRVRTDRRTPY